MNWKLTVRRWRIFDNLERDDGEEERPQREHGENGPGSAADVHGRRFLNVERWNSDDEMKSAQTMQRLRSAWGLSETPLISLRQLFVRFALITFNEMSQTRRNRKA